MQSDPSNQDLNNYSCPSTLKLDQNQLLNYRVVERNMIYVTGLPIEFLDETLIRTEQFFGQYGKVSSVVFGKPEPNNNVQNSSVFITYCSPLEACLAILSTNDFKVNGRKLKASFGMKRFCRIFFKEKKCFKKKCLFVHQLPQHCELVIQFDDSSKQIQRVTQRDTIIYFLRNRFFDTPVESTNSRWNFLPKKQTALNKIKRHLLEFQLPLQIQGK